MTKLLKISGLTVKPELPIRYPKQGTMSSKIIECLEAEPATSREIADYLDVDLERAKRLIQDLRYKGFLKHRGESQYELTDLEGASIAYHSEEDEN